MSESRNHPLYTAYMRAAGAAHQHQTQCPPCQQGQPCDDGKQLDQQLEARQNGWPEYLNCNW
ncbi:hypothetical protein [Streptomyces palmae]|uniref:Uncharacterized protein n=1 Tax=Streptomyces palmae TaxID=1701085 RepID=A0A4Z0GWX7_9ACTN|nr:hypothetical protein [Streptomyces palmae]TGB01560.1 hypothetical protein E4099_20995 [Streptomyces palmae]